MSVSPAGWQPDPRSRHEHRYWDGTQWTDHVSDRGEMSTDPVAVGGPRPEPVAAPPKPAAREVLHSRSPELASILSVIAPGSGHFYAGTSKVPLAAGLLVATAAAVVLAYLSFVLFIVGLVIWLGAAAFALTDLGGGVKGIGNTSLPPSIVAILMIAGGAVLILSLFLPWYADAGSSVSGIKILSVIDYVLLGVGIVAILVGAAALGLGPISAGELPPALPLVVAGGAAVAAVLVLLRMFVLPESGSSSVGRAPGILLALDAALVLLLANAAVLRSAAR